MEQKQKRVYQYFRSFLRVMDSYTGEVPLARFLTGFFKENKQMGSKDRKAVSRLAYHYFRLGKSAAGLDVLNRLVLAEFLCTDESPLVAAESEELTQTMASGADLEEKINLLEERTPFRLADVFPFAGHISPLIDRTAFTRQLFVQPNLFLRMRSGKEKQVMQKLESHGIAFEQLSPSALALPNSTALGQIGGIDGLVEVQDLSSQRSLNGVNVGAGEHWWDACAGAGGKSLLLLDRVPDVRLLVSDVRNSVLKNLDARFTAAGLGNEYRRKIIDLTRDTDPVLGDELFDGILLDAPCSGSGTWGRTPEMMTFFQSEALEHFAKLQRSISARVIRHLKPGCPLVYITCSVFEEENENMVAYLREELGLELVSMEYLKGYETKADTLFVAHLRRV